MRGLIKSITVLPCVGFFLATVREIPTAKETTKKYRNMCKSTGEKFTGKKNGKSNNIRVESKKNLIIKANDNTKWKSFKVSCTHQECSPNLCHCRFCRHLAFPAEKKGRKMVVIKTENFLGDFKWTFQQQRLKKETKLIHNSRDNCEKEPFSPSHNNLFLEFFFALKFYTRTF